MLMVSKSSVICLWCSCSCLLCCDIISCNRRSFTDRWDCSLCMTSAGPSDTFFNNTDLSSYTNTHIWFLNWFWNIASNMRAEFCVSVCMCLPLCVCCVCVELSAVGEWCCLSLVLSAHVSRHSAVSNTWVSDRIPEFSPNPNFYSAPNSLNSSQTHTRFITEKQKVWVCILWHIMTHYCDCVVVVVQDVVQSLQISIFLTDCQLQSTYLSVFILQTAKLLIDWALHTQ